ncbi:hypothetical protein JYU34_014077 [Plutella xylostella]|uniref:Reverse transcriptase domain-containing protein n=1 Tax=Plutella xylostella TaxID=51655 RepID=A0ABQ7Q7I8_PLUXY|nr:hypothetical protein JYU34_014077 [Plutella xylostella]
MINKLKSLSVGLFNAGSLGTGHDELIATVLRFDVDILAINETWLREGEDEKAPVVPGYKLRHTPRPRGPRLRDRGGGCGFYVKTSIKVRFRSYPVAVGVEQMWLTCTFNNVKLLIGTAYRPPWQDCEQFFDALTDSVTSFNGYDQMVLLGDFNINLLHNINDGKARQLYDFATTVSLTQLVNEPTHFTDTSETLIDVVLADSSVKNISVNYIPALGKHAFVIVELNIKKPKPTPQWITFRPLKSILLDQFNNDLNSINWECIKTISNINQMVDTFSDFITKLFDIHAPERTVRVKTFNYPWITDNLKYMMGLRDAAHNKYRITNSESHKKYYKDLKSLVSAAFHNEKRAYFQSNINNNIKNPTSLWKNLKNTVFRNHKTTELPENFNNPDDINKHFLDLPGNNNLNLTDIIYFESHKFGSNNFNLSPISEEEVAKIIKKFKSNALGYDKISLDMLILTLPRTLHIITYIINQSILTSTFPELWKIAVINPIPKITNPIDYKDLRPISLLSTLSKILEKAVSNQLTFFLETNKILPSLQSGFRKGRSTSTALIDVVDNMLAKQEKGMATLLTLLDFSRAFDTVNVSLLLAKLSYYGCDSKVVKWFYSYLDQRTQIVKLRKSDGTTSLSAKYPVTRGVPQGSILGPLLFVIYISDITTEIQHCNYHLYADDLQIYLAGSPSDVAKTCCFINQDLERIAVWSKRNSLKLNPTKSKFMVIGSRQQVLATKANNPTIVMDGGSIEQVTEARNLGLVFDSGLTFEKHVLDVVRNCFFRLRVLYRIRPYINEELRIQLCESLVLSKLNYADTVYGPCLLKKTLKLLQRVQNACARFCFCIRPRAHVTPFLNKSNLLKIAARQRLHLATMLFGIVKYQTPDYLYKKIDWSRNHHSINTRGSNYLMLTPAHKSASYRRSFKYLASKIYNNLPPPIRDLKSVSSFRSRYKMFLLNRQKQNQ